MDKNKIKSFAIWARRNLIEAVSEKAYRIGISENNIEEVIVVQGGFKLQGKEDIIPLSNKDRNALVSQVREKGFEQVIEEVAYTWFNRFMGLRYMEVNEYLPTGVRVLSSEVEGKVEPDVLTKVSEVIDDLKLNAEEIYELIDSGKTEDREKAYKMILVKQCNELGKIIPQMFEKISDYTEALLPDNLLEDGSVIRKMVEDIEEQDWKEEVEIIGWMYQYYISEKKDEVFAALKKNVKITKENIPAATQLFTPKWIVKYMVENSLGRLWLEGHPNEELQKEWKYYLEEAEQEADVEIELQKIREEHSMLRPEDIKVLDPCMGSGHILVYAFDVLYEIYKTAGYSEREIPRMILRNNLYGLDIDDRAAQLASFALIMKARHYNRRLFREIEREHLDLNLCSIQESNAIEQEAIEYFCSLKTGLDNKALRNDLEYLVTTFTDAKEYGSILEVKEVNFEELKQRLKEIENEEDLRFGDYRKILSYKVSSIIKQAEIMSRLYEVCVTNPPYMGGKGINNKLKKYIERKYEVAKSDLFSVYIERNYLYTSKFGIVSFMTPFVWMFINSYLGIRKNIVDKKDILSLIQLEYSAFEEATVPLCTFIMRNTKINYRGTYLKLTNFKGGMNVQKIKVLDAVKNDKCSYKFETNTSKFECIPGMPIVYFVSENALEKFKQSSIADYAFSDGQILTGNNEKFLMKLWEVERDNIGKSNGWVLHAKGGEYRRWYGNIETVLKWGDESINHYKNDKIARFPKEHCLFRKGITWTAITSDGRFGVRILNDTETYNKAAFSIFCNDDQNTLQLLAHMNSKVARIYINMLSPTLNNNIIDVLKIPFMINEEKRNDINNIVKQNILISKNDWDVEETSWDFTSNQFVKLIEKEKSNKLKDIFITWSMKCEEKFKQLKSNEEELNRIFIDIYGLQDELTPEVLDKDITIRKADRVRDIKSFISYAVGCMFGRYSIDAEGLIYAGGDFADKWDLENKKVRKIEKDEDGNIISDSWVESTFMADADNIIPITEDEYFEDDIVSRFIDFVRTVYSDETLEDNLDFIAESIGRKASETARQAIRRYFIKDFYKDHLKVYQKRPIYWMFDSGKNDGFKALVYMHRYNEQTVAKLRTDYLHSLQRKYEAAIQMQVSIQDSDSSSAKDKVTAKKKIDRISKQIEECREYDQVVAHLANEKITIDLDDGVKVNYAKFQGVDIISSKDKKVSMNLLGKI